MQKQITFKIKGMNRDLSESAFNPEFAYEVKNMRVTAMDDNTLLSLVNEKGTLQLGGFDDIGNQIKGVPIGQLVLDNEFILFTTQAAVGETPKSDRIYKFWFDGDLQGLQLFPYSVNTNVDLNFNVKYPIEAVGNYENEELKKVYWTDGYNQPRFINISASDGVRATWSKDSFDFVKALKLNEQISIERNLISNGEFAPGTIQYSFSYFNQYGQESNIFYISPLYYTSHSNRGGNPEEKVSNSFNITITGADTSFNYLRIYSTLRTSINATPIAKRVVDLKVSANISYTDNGLSGEIIDPTRLLYIGGEDVVFGTISHKDNTLFLGNIKLNKTPVSTTIRDYFRGKKPVFNSTTKTLDSLPTTGYYTYDNQLKYNASQIKTFKYLEWYRFGVQLQHKSGKWSEPLFMDDVRNTTKIETFFKTTSPATTPADIKIPIAQYLLNDTATLNALKANDYVSVRPVIVYPELNDREILCQGILTPTVYNVQDRYTNSPFAQASWFSRPNNSFDEADAMLQEGSYTYYFFKGFVDPIPTALQAAGAKFANNLQVYTVVFYVPSPTTDIHNDILIATSEVPVETATNTPAKTNTMYELDFTSQISYCTEVEIGRLPNWFDINILQSNTANQDGTINSKFGTWDLDTTTIVNPLRRKIVNIDSIKYGAQAEFRHDYAIPSNMKRNGEIQCIWNPPQRPYITEYQSDYLSTYIGENAENYYVDQSILTFHSPDIEFDSNLKSIDESSLKLRIVGVVPITANASDLDIQTSTPQEDGTKIGFYEESIGSENLSILAGKSLINGVFWMDSVNTTETEAKKDMYGFVVYPFHRNGSLNNAQAKADVTRAAWLSKKKMSNLKFSYNTHYFDTNKMWFAQVADSTYQTGISGVAIFDSNEQSLIKLPAPKNSGLKDITYYGNVDKVLNISRVGDKKNGYPIAISGSISQDIPNSASTLFRNKYKTISDTLINTPGYGTDPVRIKYKSTPHAVVALNYTANGAQRVLPSVIDNIYDKDTGFYYPLEVNDVSAANVRSFWNTTPYDIYQDFLEVPNISEFPDRRIGYSYLWLAELYNDNVVNRFGGTTDEALENNLWVPCGKPIQIINTNGTVKSSVTISWEEGDTYFQRYDNLKTYPYTQEDQNGVVEILSFMCETRVNLDGRYDRNRAQMNNLTATPTNFNLINPVYSQVDNFYNYRALNPNKLTLNHFPNMITWTLPKTPGEIVDSWTNITLASTLDLDGDRGTLTALKRLNNELVAFQDSGLSTILYNSRTMINTSDGVPIELANSDRVDGKRYISNSVGCANKWSIAETAQGLYFVDDIGKSIYLFNGKLEELTTKNGFRSWINNKSKALDIWNPSDFKGMVTYYDKVNKEVLFISSTECLVFSEPMGLFTSFYSYEKVPYFVTLDDVNILISPAKAGENLTSYKLWKQHGGDYNKFFDKHEPFYATVIANPEGLMDKIFNNLEFRSDTYNSLGVNQHFVTFDKLYAWNEYQSGTAVLADVQYNPSTLKKKFRVWRANIPRDSVNQRDRMRNPWVYLKLAKEGVNTFKTVLHDMTVSYFI